MTNYNTQQLASDLHWALNSIPLDTEYFSKLEKYASILAEKYNWVKISQYSSHELLNLLPVSSRIVTSDNQIAVKHETGWVILSSEGYIFSRVPTEKLVLPAFSLPEAPNTPPNEENGSEETQIVDI